MTGRSPRCSPSSARTSGPDLALSLDTSAAVKLVQREDGSDELRGRLAAHPEQVLASSVILHAELLRATRRGRPDLLGQARDLLDAVVLIEVRPQMA